MCFVNNEQIKHTQAQAYALFKLFALFTSSFVIVFRVNCSNDISTIIYQGSISLGWDGLS